MKFFIARTLKEDLSFVNGNYNESFCENVYKDVFGFISNFLKNTKEFDDLIKQIEHKIYNEKMREDTFLCTPNVENILNEKIKEKTTINLGDNNFQFIEIVPPLFASITYETYYNDFENLYRKIYVEFSHLGLRFLCKIDDFEVRLTFFFNNLCFMKLFSKNEKITSEKIFDINNIKTRYYTFYKDIKVNIEKHIFLNLLDNNLKDNKSFVVKVNYTAIIDTFEDKKFYFAYKSDIFDDPPVGYYNNSFGDGANIECYILDDKLYKKPVINYTKKIITIFPQFFSGNTIFSFNNLKNIKKDDIISILALIS